MTSVTKAPTIMVEDLKLAAIHNDEPEWADVVTALTGRDLTTTERSEVISAFRLYRRSPSFGRHAVTQLARRLEAHRG